MIKPGALVTADFPGVTGIKRRPCVVVSTRTYHQTRPDVILGLITSQVSSATAPSDFVLQDWSSAGLRKPSAFRSFLFTMPSLAVRQIGQLSDRDWSGVQTALQNAIDHH